MKVAGRFASDPNGGPTGKPELQIEAIDRYGGTYAFWCRIDTGADYELMLPDVLCGYLPLVNQIVDGAIVKDFEGKPSICDTFELEITWFGSRRFISGVKVQSGNPLVGYTLFSHGATFSHGPTNAPVRLQIDWISGLVSVDDQ